MSGMIIKPTDSLSVFLFFLVFISFSPPSPRALTSFAFNNCETNGSRHFSPIYRYVVGRERWVLCEGELKTVSIYLSPLFFPESIRPACNKKGKVTDEVHFYFEYSRTSASSESARRLSMPHKNRPSALLFKTLTMT